MTLHSKTYICLSGFGHCETNYQENKMRKLLLSTAAIGIIAASGVSAQVLESFDGIVDEIMANADANFIGAALNDADVFGNIDISVVGQSGSSSEDTTSATIITESFTSGSAGAFFGLIAGEAADFSGSFSEVTASETEALFATTTTFGDMTTLAAGAVNDVDIDVVGFGGSIQSAASASTSSTESEAFFDALGGDGLTGLVFAGNTGEIQGQIELTLDGGNFVTGNLGTTAVGAVNAGSISANFVGDVE